MSRQRRVEFATTIHLLCEKENSLNSKKIAMLSTLALTLVIGALMFRADATRAAGPVCSVPGDYATIQGAVNDVGCTTINVGPGTYAENVSIARSLTLNGAQAGNPIAGRIFGSASESTISGVTPIGAVGAVAVNASDVVINGFSVTNSVTVGAALGIVVKAGNNTTVNNNIIDTVTTPDPGGNGTAQAIYLENGPDNVKILNNGMNNIQSVRSAKGVLIGFNGGADPSKNALVQGNSITNINSGTRGAYGVSVANVIGTSGLEIRNNVINNLNGGGWAHAVGLEGDTPGVIVANNTISNLIASGADRIAVWFESNPSFSSGQVNNNNLDVTAISFGMAVQPTLTGTNVNGTCNWWGDASGPSGVGSGTGSQVSPKVTFAPWLISSAPGGACIGGNVATNKNQCKDDGWKTLVRANNTPFKNQGDCIQYVNTGK